ncbi:hypothetical protein HPP92_028966 [Vanilla planifolia]|uniref:Uncharacterized protein n=1 Tax=Vanilla planifolia TaxID=51239 RepID=A0A835P907_VANPL|nr:hypothetical protein HPP92_028966 [Vanilla planifolia]KAG0446202.1 hypothetical protein HPP92_028955 [Vanilla planifolia]
MKRHILHRGCGKPLSKKSASGRTAAEAAGFEALKGCHMVISTLAHQGLYPSVSTRAITREGTWTRGVPEGDSDFARNVWRCGVAA